MNKQEERIFAQLYNYLQNWLEDQTVGWDQRTVDFKQMYKLLKLQHQTLAILFTDKAPLTVEEKDSFIVRYDKIPANAYFLGTHRL